LVRIYKLLINESHCLIEDAKEDLEGDGFENEDYDDEEYDGEEEGDDSDTITNDEVFKLFENLNLNF
jgi:hypothetical protein